MINIDIYEKDTPEIIAEKVEAAIKGKVIFGNNDKFKFSDIKYPLNRYEQEWNDL